MEKWKICFFVMPLFFVQTCAFAEVFSCIENGQKVLRSDGCANSMGRTQAQPQMQPNPPYQARTKTIGELKESCPARFEQLANLAPKIGNYAHQLKLNILRAQCLTRDVDCFNRFDAIYAKSNVTGDPLLRGKKNAIAREASTVAEMCGVPFSYDRPVTCTTNGRITNCN